MAVTEALVHVKNTLLPLWLWVLLFSYEWSLVVNSQRHGPAEVVIPKRHASRMQPPGWLTYSLHFGGQRHIVHMKVNKLFLSKQLPVFTYTDQGALVEDQPFVQNDCYYHGYVEGDPESLVTLSTCMGGFQGILQTNDIVYEIEPKRHSTTFEHFIYKMDSEETQFPPMRCGLTDEEIAEQLKFQESINFTLMQSEYEGWWTHKRILELAVVVDHNRYLHYESNTSTVQYVVFIIVNEIDKFLNPLDIDVVLMGMEIWTEENPITLETIGALLDAFSRWKMLGFNNRLPHDVAHAFVKKHYGITVGLAYVGTVCILRHNTGVESFMTDNLHTFAYIVSHEIGHNLGMHHDDKTCVCERKHCIMYPSQAAASTFSNCSYAAFMNTIAKRNCMYISSNIENIFTLKRCGNSVVEEGEQCDCGTLSLCMKDRCCASNCTLKRGAACAFGLCCKNCRIVPTGKLCRRQKNECDLPEWCNGKSYHCPKDVYVQNGNPCKGGGHCYEKRCNNREEQCRKIFGKDAKSANQICYRQMNTQGDRFGNCGIKNAAYVKCDISDILCGRIQCENVTEIPHLRDHSTVHWTRFNGITCWGTDYHLGMTIPDIGDVKDGTECGTEHICVERKCVNLSFLLTNCLPKTCNMNGVCNNRHHCHCDSKWHPPFCLKNGSGGSIDSGPPPQEILQGKKKNFSLMLLWLIPFFVLLCLLILCFMPKKKEEPEDKNIADSSDNEEQHD
ncbi:PREDICTED: disintegrin and metalloproteinase domain-containing protein 20-like [Miniopterus natalensis]|uniref:disintegrin and metalloproteinase domain-containing protein 20-like n=1 Tax=Miniopterus natalensis TaxID=291302 RepID=UPI0007A6B592|nr:PREDICTED: disintegrin and metalloproteinase domain-containing protein 20-like [Miniopterus natalensis]